MGACGWMGTGAAVQKSALTRYRQRARRACEMKVSCMNGKKKKKKSTVITRQGAAGFLTFAGRLRCERLLLLLASQLSRVCRVPSSRSRQQRRLARGAAQSTANFLCTHRTRSAVGAVPFRPRGVEGDKKKKKEKKEQWR